jgi:hypothetical protein
MLSFSLSLGWVGLLYICVSVLVFVCMCMSLLMVLRTCYLHILCKHILEFLHTRCLSLKINISDPALV